MAKLFLEKAQIAISRSIRGVISGVGQKIGQIKAVLKFARVFPKKNFNPIVSRLKVMHRDFIG